MISKKSISREVRFFRGVCGTKYLNRARKKNCAREFLVLPALQICSCELVVFMDGRPFILAEGWDFLHLY